MKKLTICVPTYNRCNSILQLVSEIIDDNLLDIVNVIIIDDGSDDATLVSLNKLSNQVGLKILTNIKNKGLAYTFLRFFNECETDYLMIIADDDMILAEGVKNLIFFLERLSPDFVSTTWLGENGKPMRGKKYEARIDWIDLRGSANHAPGLVYRLATVLPILEIMHSRLNRGCYATSMFPQVVMVIMQSFTSFNAWWCPIISGGYRLIGPMPSQLFDSNGDSYASISGVWREQLAFIDLYSYIASTIDDPSKKRIAERLMELHCLGIYNRFEEALTYEGKLGREGEIAETFFHLGLAFKIFKRPFKSITYAFKYVQLKFRSFFI